MVKPETSSGNPVSHWDSQMKPFVWADKTMPYAPEGDRPYGFAKVSTNFLDRLNTNYVEFLILAVYAFKQSKTIFGIPLNKIMETIEGTAASLMNPLMTGDQVAEDEAAEQKKKNDDM